MKPVHELLAPPQADIASALPNGDLTHPVADDLPYDAALRAIGNVRGAVLVVDCKTRRVACAGSPDNGSEWRPWEGRSGRSIAAFARRLVALRTRNATAPTLPQRVGRTFILSVAQFSPESHGAATPFVAVHVAPAARDPRARERLSPREGQVAHFLVEGYSNVNIAALCGVSTNTTRTLIQRIYRKLGVCNRADLVERNAALLDWNYFFGAPHCILDSMQATVRSCSAPHRPRRMAATPSGAHSQFWTGCATRHR